MSPLTRLACVAALVAVSAGALGASILNQELTCHQATGSPTVDDQLEALKDRVAKKQRIAEDLIIGRLTVPEAASKLGSLNLPPIFWQMVSLPDPTATIEECLCRYVTELALDLVVDSSQTEVLKQRFEREVQQARDASGRLRFPTPFLVLSADAADVAVTID